MDVGILFDLRNPVQWQTSWARSYARALEICEEADRLDAGGVWFSEHHRFEDGYLPQVLTFAAAAAARTSRVRIGTSVLIPALRKPAQLAEEAAVVDILSDGRLELGLGAGYRVPEYELFDADMRERFPRTEESIREIRRLWTEKIVTPPPVQDPVSMWGGFYGPRGARMAGRLGIGLLHISAALREPYLAGFAEGGHDPAGARMSGLLPIVLADDPEAAWPRIAPHLAHQKNTYRRYSVEGTDRPVPPDIDPEQLRRPGPDGSPPAFQVLTAEDAAAYVREQCAGLPVEHVIFWASIAGMPEDLVDRNVELICGKLPALLA